MSRMSFTGDLLRVLTFGSDHKVLRGYSHQFRRFESTVSSYLVSCLKRRESSSEGPTVPVFRFRTTHGHVGEVASFERHRDWVWVRTEV